MGWLVGCPVGKQISERVTAIAVPVYRNVTVVGNVMLVSPVLSRNASGAMVAVVSQKMITPVKLAQYAKARVSILVTEAGMAMLVKPVS